MILPPITQAVLGQAKVPDQVSMFWCLALDSAHGIPCSCLHSFAHKLRTQRARF